LFCDENKRVNIGAAGNTNESECYTAAAQAGYQYAYIAQPDPMSMAFPPE
jgi:hypothetical protein